MERYPRLALMLALALVQVGCAGFLAINDNRGTAARLAPFACCLVLPAGLLAPKPGLVAVVMVSHITLYSGLTWLFGRSLRPGREPLVTYLASTVEPMLNAAVRRYTRQVTWLWTLYGPVQIILSLILLASAPVPVWSAFVNLVDPLLLALTFLAEYGFRRWWLRGSSIASLRDTLVAARVNWRREPGS